MGIIKLITKCPICEADVRTHVKGPVIVELLTGEKVDLSVWLTLQEEEKRRNK